MNKNWTALKKATAPSGWAGIVESKGMLSGCIHCTPTSSTDLQGPPQLLRTFATFSDFDSMSRWKWKAQGIKVPKTPGVVAKLDVCMFTSACSVFPSFKAKFLLPFGKDFELEAWGIIWVWVKMYCTERAALGKHGQVLQSQCGW